MSENIIITAVSSSLVFQPLYEVAEGVARLAKLSSNLPLHSLDRG